jgi:hypothetical protein
MNKQTFSRTRKDVEAHIIAQSWKDEAYKQEILSNSKTVIEREFGVQLPAEINVQVLEENPTTLYFVLPMRPISTELTEEQLETVAGGLEIPVLGEIYDKGKDFGHTVGELLDL